MLGLFNVLNDERYGAAFITKDNTVLFPKKNGLVLRDEPQMGNMSDISENALFSSFKSDTLLEAANAKMENREPRWKLPNF